jgi:hypothetical protein
LRFANARAAASPPASAQTVPLYRLFSHKTGIHFYTIDVNRKLSAMSAGWTVEGVATHVLDQQAVDTVPLYVLTNRLCYYGQYGDAFTFTTTVEERDKLQAAPKFGTCDSGGTWLPDGTGIACYIAAKKLTGTTPLYRLIHPPKNPDILKFMDFDSLFTTSEPEMTDAINNHGYKFVRIEGYVWPQPTWVMPHLSVGSSPPNPDKDLLNRGCTREGFGMYNCPTVGSYDACQSYRNSGAVKACNTTADLEKQKSMDKDLFSRGCKRFLGRPDEFLCQTQKSFDACEGYRKSGGAKKCLMAKQ